MGRCTLERGLGQRRINPRRVARTTASVRLWAPTLGHYVQSFDLTFEEAQERMLRDPVPTSSRANQCGSDEVNVLFEAQDPGGDPNASVVIRVRLVQQEGRWRVWWVGFDRSQRHLRTAKPTDAESRRAGTPGAT